MISNLLKGGKPDFCWVDSPFGVCALAQICRWRFIDHVTGFLYYKKRALPDMSIWHQKKIEWVTLYLITISCTKRLSAQSVR